MHEAILLTRVASKNFKKLKSSFELFFARVYLEIPVIIYILLTKREGRTGRISARGLDSTDRAQRGPYKKDRGPIFS